MYWLELTITCHGIIIYHNANDLQLRSLFMFKKFFSIILIFSLIFILSSCTIKDNSSSFPTNGKLNVVASFNPISEFAKEIGGNRINVYTVVPNGTDPHDFEIRTSDMKAIAKADVFIINGLGMENWAESAISAANKSTLGIVDATANIKPIINMDKSEIKDHGMYDPHSWLSLNSAKLEAFNIKEALVKADPNGKTYYENNYLKFAGQLEELNTEYQKKFKNVRNKNFVTGHAAFAYLCRDFGLNQESVENIFAEGEPTPKKMEELIKFCKNNNVSTVFVEDMVSPKVSQTLANEVNAKVEKIYTLESNETGKSYIETMRVNLENIYQSLK
jgi:zinc transport system substrate-binding protein